MSTRGIGTILAMATSLSLNVIAKGVESQAQLKLLASLGGTNYQGYLFSQPVPIKNLDALLRQKGK